MSKLLVLNPNTCQEMTADIKETIALIRRCGMDVQVCSVEFGPRSLESFYDYNLASYAMLKYFKDHPECKPDGILVACFGDPGLYALKEISDCPVIGIAEASLSIALLLGQKFSILAASDKAIPLMYDLVNNYGLNSRIASVESLHSSVLKLEDDRNEALSSLVYAGQNAKNKGAEVLVLGCAGMTGMRHAAEQELGIPVLDPVELAYKQLELIVELNLSVSKQGLFQTPREQVLEKDWYLNLSLDVVSATHAHKDYS